MAQLVRDLMTADPVALPVDAPVRLAAQYMRDRDVGDVLVLDSGSLAGIVTDRDLVVRALADRSDLSDVHLRDVRGDEDVITARPDEVADVAIARMREHAVRRIPVIDEERRPVGVLSLGDAAMERDENSALADVSAAAGNSGRR
jgi:CBS domain-containing protein